MLTSSHFSRSSFNKGPAYRQAGFTLIELLVVVAVITIITGFFLFNQGKFNSSTLLRSLAYSVALSVRQAQTFGTSVRGTTAASFSPSYGLYLNTGDLALSRYYIFADQAPQNSAYDLGEGLPAYKIPPGYFVSRFCAINGSVQDCYPSGFGGGTTLDSLTIYFRRPHPDASFSASCTGSCNTPYSSVYIQMRSAGGPDTRSIKITNTGQITICPLNVDPPTC